MKNKSQEIHHTSYSLYGKSDKPGVNVFPVCKQCHDNECHSADNWIKDPTHPTLKNRNSRSFTKKLQQNMKALTVEAEDPTQMTVTSAEGGLVIEIKYINSNVTHKILINPDRYVCIRTLYRCGGLKDKARPSDFKNSDACKKKIENIRRKEKIDADFFPGNVPTIKPLWVHPDLAKEYVSYLGNHIEVSLLTRSLDKVLNHSDIEANIHTLPTRPLVALVKDESVIESIVTRNNMEDVVIGDDVKFEDQRIIIDSRLVAKKLGIEHSSLLKTIDTNPEYYQKRLKIKYSSEKRTDGGHPTRFCWLTEKQLYALTFRSDLTEPVMDVCELLLDRLSCLGSDEKKRHTNTPEPSLTQEAADYDPGIRHYKAMTEFLKIVDQMTSLYGKDYVYSLLNGGPLPLKEIHIKTRTHATTGEKISGVEINEIKELCDPSIKHITNEAVSNALKSIGQDPETALGSGIVTKRAKVLLDSRLVPALVDEINRQHGKPGILIPLDGKFAPIEQVFLRPKGQ